MPAQLSTLNFKFIFRSMFGPSSKIGLLAIATLILSLGAPAALAASTSDADSSTSKGTEDQSDRSVSKKRERRRALADGGQGYGMAGCGLGSILFGEHPGGVQILASTTNEIYYNNSFAVTSGTSNCDPDEAQELAVQIFIESNRTPMENDVARGGGETLSAFFDVAGCSSMLPMALPKSTARPEAAQPTAQPLPLQQDDLNKLSTLNKLLQTHYQTIFKQDAKADQVARSIRETIRGNLATAQACRNLG